MRIILGLVTSIFCVSIVEAQQVVCQDQTTYIKRVYNHGFCPYNSIKIGTTANQGYINLSSQLNQLNQQFAPVQQAPQIPLEEQNIFQRSGVTDPLLQRFGQRLGGVLGVETRSANQILLDRLQTLDLTTKQGLTEAAQIYMQLGDSQTAIKLLQLTARMN
jgi:hypothetical protein